MFVVKALKRDRRFSEHTYLTVGGRKANLKNKQEGYGPFSPDKSDIKDLEGNTSQ